MANKPKYCPSLKLGIGTVVCNECDIVGEVTLGSRSIVHPKATIIAEAGPIIIGEGNIIEEQVKIVNRLKAGDPADMQKVMIIGNHNMFEVGCQCESLKVGDHNVFEAKCYIGEETEVSNGCVIGALCSLTSNEVLPENTVIYGEDCRRRSQHEKPPPQTLQIDFLTKLLPNYHYLMRGQKIAGTSGGGTVNANANK